MELTEIRIKLIDNRQDRLKGFCSITIDNQFVIRDLKIIEGTDGFFVAMPSRKVTRRCPSCKTKNHLRAKYCNECGKSQKTKRTQQQNRQKLHADIAHPINADCRDFLQFHIIQAYEAELERSKQPDYIPSYIDFDDEEFDFTEPDHEEKQHTDLGPDNQKNNDFSAGIL